MNFLCRDENGKEIPEKDDGMDINQESILIPLDLSHHSLTDINIDSKKGTARDQLRSRYQLVDLSGQPIPYYQKDLDVKCFPEIYPTGRFGINYQRIVNLSRTKFIHNRMRHSDRRFMKADYLFFLVHQSDLSQINSSVVFQLKKALPSNYTVRETLFEENSELDELYQSFFPSLRGHKDYFAE